MVEITLTRWQFDRLEAGETQQVNVMNDDRTFILYPHTFDEPPTWAILDAGGSVIVNVFAAIGENTADHAEVKVGVEPKPKFV